MKKRHLWLLLPVISMWGLWIIGFYALPDDAMSEWWAFPLAMTLTAVFIVTLFAALLQGMRVKSTYNNHPAPRR